MDIETKLIYDANHVYREGYNQGYKDKSNNLYPMIKEIHDNVYQEGIKRGKTEVIDKALQIIHNVYTQYLYCLDELCDRDNQGYDCKDCLYKSIKCNLEILKEQNETN